MTVQHPSSLRMRSFVIWGGGNDKYDQQPIFAALRFSHAHAPTASPSLPCPFTARSITNKLCAELGGKSHKAKTPWTRDK